MSTITNTTTTMTKTEQNGDQTREPSLSGKSSRSNTSSENHDRWHDDDDATRKGRENAKTESKDSNDGNTEDGKKSNKFGPVESFDKMGLKTNVLRGIYSYGFEEPSPIQQRAIMPIIAGRNVIAQAQAGTGKTGAFVIAALEKIDTKIRETQTIIVSPVRELARQSHTVATCLGDYTKITTHLCVGGNRFFDDKDAFRKGVQIAIGTPGRIFHLIREGVLRTDDVKMIVIDEADEMLSHGFREQIYDIFESLRKDVQVVLVSATMPEEVLELTQKFMSDSVEILVKETSLTLDGLKQFYIALDQSDWKLPTLVDLFDTLSINQSIIFANTRRTVQWLEDELTRRDHVVSAIHSDLKDQERRDVVTAFRNGKSRVLISTDILARGIDFQNLSLVVNFDLPGNKENYIHRIGRAGRFGRNGVTINLVTNRDASTLRELERFYNTKIEEMPANIAEYMS